MGDVARHDEERVNPARAGMIRRVEAPDGQEERKPRASGDDPIGADLLWTGIQ